MVIGPDKGDLPVMRKLCRETGCDVWFPFYPLCMEHCVTAVSYTHLDVYKRQPNCRAKFYRQEADYTISEPAEEANPDWNVSTCLLYTSTKLDNIVRAIVISVVLFVLAVGLTVFIIIRIRRRKMKMCIRDSYNSVVQSVEGVCRQRKRRKLLRG